MARKKRFDESEEEEDYSNQDDDYNDDDDDQDEDEDDDNVFAPENNEDEKLTKEQNPQENLDAATIAPACQERLGPARKPLNAFSFFKAEEFDSTRTANPQLTMMEVIDLIGQKWGDLGKSKRDNYQQKFEQHKNMILHPVKSRNGASGKMIIEESTTEDLQDQKVIDSAKKSQKKLKV